MTKKELELLQKKEVDLKNTIRKAKDIVNEIDVVDSTLKCINSVRVPYSSTIYTSRNECFDLPFNSTEMADLWSTFKGELIKRLKQKKEGLEKQFAELKFE